MYIQKHKDKAFPKLLVKMFLSGSILYGVIEMFTRIILAASLYDYNYLTVTKSE